MQITHAEYLNALQRRLELNQELEKVQAIIEQVETAARDAMVKGVPVQGFQLKPGRCARKVFDKEGLIKALLNVDKDFELYKVELKGIPAIEKELKRLGFSTNGVDELLCDYIDIIQGTPTVEYVG